MDAECGTFCSTGVKHGMAAKDGSHCIFVSKVQICMFLETLDFCSSRFLSKGERMETFAVLSFNVKVLSLRFVSKSFLAAKAAAAPVCCVR